MPHLIIQTQTKKYWQINLKYSYLILCLKVLLITEIYAFDNYPKNNAFDVITYDFYLYLNDNNDSIYGETRIDLKAKNRKKQSLTLDLSTVSNKTNGRGMLVDSVLVMGNKTVFTHESDQLILILKEAVEIDQLISIKVFYKGIPTDGLIISENKYGSRTFFGDNWPNRAHHWLPCIDHPYDKAFCTFTVEAPRHYEVIGPGKKTEESLTNRETKITSWESTAPMATKVMVIGVAPFAIQYLPAVNNIPVQNWVFPENKDAGFYDYSPASEVLAYFEQRIGTFAYAKLANVQSKTKYGGMENASNIFYFENSVTGNKTIENLIAHEVAHQWFGDAVTEADWHHVWLSEGFATYFTNLYIEHKYGKDSLNRSLQKQKQQIFDYYQTNPASSVIDFNISNLNDLLNTNTYQKGSWVLHMLRQELGDEVFFNGIKTYYRNYKNGNALTQDFQFIMEKVSGKSLEWFFEQWLYQPGLPKIQTTWKYDRRKKTLKLTVEQVQKEAPFKFTLDLKVLLNQDQVAYQHININQRIHTFELPLSGKPKIIEFDPFKKLLLFRE